MTANATARWTDRQLAMLREMGISPWPAGLHPASAQQDEAVVAGPAAMAHAAAAEPAQVMPPQPRVPPAGQPAAAPVVVSPPARRPASAGAVAGMDWEALRQTVAACTACGLCEGRTQTVFGVGHPQAQWMLVGEAPGQQEDLRGEPFVGQAGQLLDAMLRAVGLTREAAEPQRQVYIANVLKCRPPHNRNPLPEEVAQCEPFLVRQVELVRPKLILAMGRFAVQSLLQSQEPIGRLRGKVHQYHGVPVVVTYHPAYLLRNPLDKSRAWEDLCLAREVLAHAS